MSESPPSESAPAAPKPVLHLRKPGNAASFVSDAPPVPVRHEPPPERKKPARASLGLAGYTQPAAWAMFLILGGLMAMIRYRGLWHLEYEFRTYGPSVVLALHLAVVAMAFKEDLFTGVLCLAVPGYSLYYLLQSGHPFFSAVVFGLLAGLGQDAFGALREASSNCYDQVTEWMTGSRRK